MAPPIAAAQLPNILREMLAALVADHRPDLNVRQLAVFLTCYLKKSPQSAAQLSDDIGFLARPTFRTLRRLAELKLISLEPDPKGHRRWLVGPTAEGRALFRMLRATTTAAAARRP